MKKFLTNNIGLKIASVLASIILWIVVINVDDPVITRIYTGIPVEITNESAITSEGKTYEIAEGYETISVSVSANRSIIEALSKDNIKAVADMKNLTFMDTVPIELKATRYSDKINSMSSRTANLSVIIESRKDKQIKLSVSTQGKVASGYIAGEITPDVDVVKVTGPESKVDEVSSAEIKVDFSDMNETFTMSCPITLYDASGNVIDDQSIEVSKSEIRTTVEILETKEIPVTASFSGTPAPGYGTTGIVICEPSSIVVAGKGAAFERLSAVNIPDSALSVDGASDNVSVNVNISEYMPDGVILADSSFGGEVNVVAVVEPHESRVVNLSVSNISVVNLPENYSAHIVSGEEVIPVEIGGLPNELVQVSSDNLTAQIDAAALAPRLGEDEVLEEGTEIYVGVNDGAVYLNLPAGITQNTSLSLEVVINYTGEKNDEE